MRPSRALDQNRRALTALLVQHNLTNGRVFGSVARGDDSEDSDLDLLVDPQPNVTTLFDIVAMKAAAERLLGVPVDVRTESELHDLFRAKAVSEAKPL